MVEMHIDMHLKLMYHVYVKCEWATAANTHTEVVFHQTQY